MNKVHLISTRIATAESGEFTVMKLVIVVGGQKTQSFRLVWNAVLGQALFIPAQFRASTIYPARHFACLQQTLFVTFLSTLFFSLFSSPSWLEPKTQQGRVQCKTRHHAAAAATPPAPTAETCRDNRGETRRRK